MDYDKDKVDELTLALLYLGMTKDKSGGRAWKTFDLTTLKRLREKGWIEEPRIRDVTLKVTPEGMKRAEELFQHWCGSSKASG